MMASGAWRLSRRRSPRQRAFVIAAVAVLLSSLALTLAAETAHAAGPWRAQVVDAETGQPLAGVVVLAAWWLRSPGAVHERREFYEAHEVVTDDDGRFLVPSVPTIPPNPFARIQGPDLKIFKSGYGQWQFRGEPPILVSDVMERNAWLEQAWRRFEGDGVVIELPPLKTREERRGFRGQSRPAPDFPRERAPALMRALEEEDYWLGIRKHHAD
jgi:hypothetical protein